MNILEEIKVFLNQPNSVGALLLTGKWGCGKTFFIENTLAEDNQITDNYVPIRVSLFGATTPKSINDKIKKEYLVKRFPVKSDSKIKMLPSIMKKGTSVLAQAIPLFGALNTALSVDWLDFVEVNDIANKKVVLVIDDLERCNMNIQDIFGCLNEYVETKQIKTIIIADEDIIRSKDIKDEEDSTITHSNAL